MENPEVHTTLFQTFNPQLHVKMHFQQCTYIYHTTQFLRLLHKEVRPTNLQSMHYCYDKLECEVIEVSANMAERTKCPKWLHLVIFMGKSPENYFSYTKSPDTLFYKRSAWS